jgi:MraZ protein
MNPPAIDFYVGTFRHSLDAKNRLTIPAKWRFAGDDVEGSYLALPNDNGSITVYPGDMARELYAKIRNVGMLSDPQEQSALYNLFASADRFGCDAQGRIGLSEDLRNMAGLGKDVVLTGTMATFHICSPEAYEAIRANRPAPNAGKAGYDRAILKKYGL